MSSLRGRPAGAAPMDWGHCQGSGRETPVWQNPPLYSTGLGGEIGRRAGLKIPFRKECRFDSDPRHQALSAGACDERGDPT